MKKSALRRAPTYDLGPLIIASSNSSLLNVVAIYKGSIQLLLLLLRIQLPWLLNALFRKVKNAFLKQHFGGQVYVFNLFEARASLAAS